MRALLVVFLAISLVVASDLVSEYTKCVKTCRKEKNSFGFCVSFCKPKSIPRKPINQTLPVKADEEVQADSALGDIPDSKELWKKYRTVLRDFLRQGDDSLFPGLQLVPQPFAADWDEDISILYNLANRLPKPGQAYEQSVYELNNEYGDFITNVVLPEDKPIDQAKLRAARREISAIEDLIDEADAACADKYDAKGNRRSPTLPPLPPYPEFAHTSCKEIDEHKAARTSALYNYEVLRRQEFGEHLGLKDAVVKFSDARAKGQFKFNALGSMARFVEAAKAQRTTGFEVKINQYTKTSTEKTSSMSIDVGYKNDFITVGAGLQKTSLKLTTQNKEFQLVVGAVGYKYIPVTPERTWFSPEVIYKYGRYPLRTAKDYFGPQGTMHLIPKGFIVVVGPKVTMLLNQEDTSKVEKTQNIKANLNVGGFEFKFDKGATMKKSSEAGNLFKVTIEGNSYEPQILAVDNWIPSLDMK
jgi:hypothetical protein